jgi:hypothetical protein
VFDEIEMGRTRCVHEKTCLVNSICDLGTGEGKILEGTKETTIESGIIEKITEGSRKF